MLVEHNRPRLSIEAARGAQAPPNNPEQENQGTRTQKVATQQLNQVVASPKKGFFGRLVGKTKSSNTSANDHFFSWQRGGIVGGVEYMLKRLQEIDMSFYQVYLLECTIKDRAYELLRLPGMTFPCPLKPIQGLSDERLWSLLTRSVRIDCDDDMKFRPGVCSGPIAYTKVTIGGENDSDVMLTKIYTPPYCMTTVANDFQRTERALGKCEEIDIGNLKSEGKWTRHTITQETWQNIVSKIPSNSPLLQLVPLANKFFEDIDAICNRNGKYTKTKKMQFTASQTQFKDKIRHVIALAMKHSFSEQHTDLVRLEAITNSSILLEMAATAMTEIVSKKLNTTDLFAYCDFSRWGNRAFKKLW